MMTVVPGAASTRTVLCAVCVVSTGRSSEKNRPFGPSKYVQAGRASRVSRNGGIFMAALSVGGVGYLKAAGGFR